VGSTSIVLPRWLRSRRGSNDWVWARPVAALLFDATSVQSRFEGVGAVSADWCRERGFVGPIARAAGVPRDVRHDYPYGVYRFAQIPVASAWAGDVFARALIRWLEIQRSLEFVAEQVSGLPKGEPLRPCGLLAPGELVVALEEGWRGEVARSGDHDAGRIRRRKVTDPPSGIDALALAMPNQISIFRSATELQLSMRVMISDA
jgi:Ni,Fe-hydrogenase III large subunit